MVGLLAVVAITEVVAMNVSFLGFYNESGLTGYDNIADINITPTTLQKQTFVS